MFAVLKTGGKQYRVEKDQILIVEKISGVTGELVQFNEILILSGKSNVIGKPTITGAAVQAEVVEQIRDKKSNFIC
jgi:large subunit ribosomal protein L21